MAAAEKQMHSMEWQSAKAKANKQINNWAQYMPDLEGKSESKVIGPRFKFTPRFHRPNTSGNLPKVRCRQFKGGGDDKHTRTSEWHPSFTIFCLNFSVNFIGVYRHKTGQDGHFRDSSIIKDYPIAHI